MSINMKLWDQLNALHDALLPGRKHRMAHMHQTHWNHVIQLDDGKAEREVKGTISHGYMASWDEHARDGIEQFGLYGSCLKAFEDNKDMWGY